MLLGSYRMCETRQRQRDSKDKTETRTMKDLRDEGERYKETEQNKRSNDDERRIAPWVLVCVVRFFLLVSEGVIKRDEGVAREPKGSKAPPLPSRLCPTPFP